MTTPNTPPLNVLASVYACGPNWGSEIGMGWNWVISLAQHCQLAVITELGFRDAIEADLPRLDLRYPPTFYYVDVGERARRQFWNQGDWRFYKHYHHWQSASLRLARTLLQSGAFDLIHQLNMIGYREPGYLWTLNLPLVWGPIGGHAQMPWRYLPGLGPKAGAFYLLRNVLNALQMRKSRRVRKAMAAVNGLVAATDADLLAIRRYHQREAVLINETGSLLNRPSSKKPISFFENPQLRLCWSGKFIGLKALHLGLHSLASLRPRTEVRLDIVGDGPLRHKWNHLASSLGLEGVCTWHGQVPHERCIDLISKCHALLFTSLQEGTPHVVLEALSVGTPVICHDACGHGAVVDNLSGIKIPVQGPRNSVAGFTGAVQILADSPALRTNLSHGALARAASLTWAQKALEMVAVYRSAILDFSRPKEGKWTHHRT